MNRISLILVFLYVSNLLQAQNHLISFTGSGAATTVGSVEVENLNNGTKLTMNGNDTLHLTSNAGMAESGQTSEIMVFPNPMENNTSVILNSRFSAPAIVCIYDLGGNRIYSRDIHLQVGSNQFEVSGLGSGIYLLRFECSAFQSSTRLVSLGAEPKTPSIRLSGNTYGYEMSSSRTGSRNLVQMQFTSGDRLLFTGISGIYKRVVTLLPVQDQTVDFEFLPCTDGDGNHYKIVTIGSQTWMAENLKTTRFKNGSLIPNVTDANTWITLNTPAFCWFDNNQALNGNTYGALYNWHTLPGEKLCPVDWHVPTHDEWMVLSDFLGGDTIAGAKLKETGHTHWVSLNVASNETGFTALPGASRSHLSFTFKGFQGLWWSVSDTAVQYSINGIGRELYYSSEKFMTVAYQKYNGLSVRCVRDTCFAPPPTTADAGNDLLNLPGTTVTLAANQPINGSGRWSIKAGSGGSFADSSLFSTSFTGQPCTTYKLFWTITNVCAKSTVDSILVSFTPGVYPVYDVDCNGYDTVHIGTQVWLKQNLKTTRLYDGTTIPLTTNNNTWGSTYTPAYCWYNNDTLNKHVYGGLYNWFVVETLKLCPVGWHVPSDTAFNILRDHLGGATVAGGKMKEAGTTFWNSPNTGATNESGFSARPGGLRSPNGLFQWINNRGSWWISNPRTYIASRWARSVRYDTGMLIPSEENYQSGFSVRCVKD